MDNLQPSLLDHSLESSPDAKATRPLAERLRPRTFESMVGQPRLISGSSRWKRAAEPGTVLPSLLLFGPPGCGKTTFARILCGRPDVATETCHATETGAKLLKEVCERARHRRVVERKRTIVFVDEIHRLNRAQQDVLLASLETGDVSLLGATTENPSHTLNPALISRCQVLAFEPLSTLDLTELARRGFQECGFDLNSLLEPDALSLLLQVSDGDARRLLNSIEWLSEQIVAESTTDGSPKTANLRFSAQSLRDRLGEMMVRFDKDGHEHHDLISALIKSIRGSDPDASLYYLARLIKGGEDIAFLARRLMVLASEDIGNADPRALQIAVSGAEAVTRIGYPEARIIFSQVVSYLACAPKSNSSYVAIDAALSTVESTGSLPVPLALRSSKTSMSKSLGYGRDYRYSHDGERGYVEQSFLPKELGSARFLELSDRGFEKTMKQYQDWVRNRPVKDETKS